MVSRKIENIRLFWLAITSLIIGSLTTYYWQSFLVLFSLYLLWLISRILQLEKWIIGGIQIKEAPNSYDDTYGRIINHLIRVKYQMINSKKKHKKVIARFNEIIRSFPHPTIVINASNEIQWVSKEATKMLHLNRKKDIGIRIDNIIRLPKFKNSLTNPEYSELQISSPVNDSIILMIAISKLNKDTRILSIRDISSRHNLDTMHKNFIANASHELRTPLTIINGNLKMLGQDNSLSKNNKEMLDSAYQNSQNMSILLNDLLTLSNLENQTISSIKQKINVANTINEVMQNLKNTAPISHKILIKADKNLCIKGIHSQIYSMVFNLIENAIKYSDKDKEIQIIWQIVDSHPQFSVIDQGIGINEEQLPHITEAFYRTNLAQQQHIKGTGLGLCIVKQIVQQNKGQLLINSTLGEGSVFTIIFAKD